MRFSVTKDLDADENVDLFVMAGQTEALYRIIVEEVIRNSREDFASEGVEESTLLHLQRLWEQKLFQQTNGAALEHYDQSFEDYQHQQHQQHAHYAPMMASSAAAIAARAAQPPALALGGEDDGKPKQYMNKAVSSGAAGRPYVPQHDGADDVQPSREELDATLTSRSASRAQRVGQFDGEGDSDEEYGAEAPAPSALNEEEDDDLSSISLDEDDDDAVETENEVLCQYDKVSHSKNSKWRAVLKDGIMHIGGRDYFFAKATGEFTW